LAAVFSARLLGLFMIYPVFASYAQHWRGATPVTIGLALGIYGLAQGSLQMPLGALSDRVGRKPIIIGGLAIFAAGSALAATSVSIGGIIVGRAVQGAGAVGSSILALVGDLTRSEVRTRAMALVGASIGLSFALALLLGPTLAVHFGLRGIFWATAFLALVAIAIVIALVPTPPATGGIAPAGAIGHVLRNGDLLRLDASVFSIHAILTATFLVAPGSLQAALHLPPGSQWLVYLGVLVASLLLMLPLVLAAEVRGHVKGVLLLALAAFIGGLALIGLGGAIPVLGGLVAFFTAFNTAEALLPSLVTKTAPAEARGAATGVYSTAQFMGIFVGGAGGGWLLAAGGAPAVLVGAIVLALGWLVLIATEPRAAARTGG
jgi:MFS family permease